MSRRHLTLAVVALASLVLSACGTSPTAPQGGIRTPSGSSADSLQIRLDSINFSGWSGSNG
jgi:hypothetical protein